MKTPKKPKTDDAAKAKGISDQAVEIAEWAAKALVAAEELGIEERTRSNISSCLLHSEMSFCWFPEFRRQSRPSWRRTSRLSLWRKSAA